MDIPEKLSYPGSARSSPSASSSPSHEFSFTITLCPQTAVKVDRHDDGDLSPADDIFFYGHLLPLHVSSHLPVSPRSSTNSLDSFTLPIKDLVNDQTAPASPCSVAVPSTAATSLHKESTDGERQGSKIKAKSFSLFGLPKWRKGCEERQREGGDKDGNDKKKLRFEVGGALKRYARMVRPLLSFRKSARARVEFQRQAYSFSGGTRSRARAEEWLRGKRGEASEPATMRTSPANSGRILLTPGILSPVKSACDSTMEELQAAIQAAIAHCKNSIAMEEKLCPKN